MRDRSKNFIIIASVIACILLYFIEQVLVMSYFVKTLCKLLFFTILPIIYMRFINELRTSGRIKINKKDLYIGVGLGILCFVVLMVAYYILKDVIVLNTIARELQ